MRDDETPEPTDNRWSSPAATDGVLRLTYDQIGRRLGMTADAARQLARRKGWPRTRPNTIGEPVVVSVPASELSSEQPLVHRRTTYGELSIDRRTTDDEPSVTGTGPPSVDRRSDLHAQALAALEDALTAANTRAQEAMTLADRLAAQFAAAGARTNDEITTLRAVVDGLRGTNAREEERAIQAERRAIEAERVEAEAKAARQSAETRAANLEADLRAKDAEIAEQRLAAEQAQAGVQQARQKADGLRERVEGAERDLAVARHDAEAAQQAAAELRLAEVGRKARGRWARLRAAWRGE